MSLDPIHPRVEMILSFLKINNNIEVKNLTKNSKINKINYITLGFFNLVAFFKSIKYIKNFSGEIVYITDLQYLPIAIIGKLYKKKVIYETLDNNVELYFYNLNKRFSFIKSFAFLKSFFKYLEKKVSSIFVDRIIVNSKALKEYFLPLKSEIIFYASPFENKFKINYYLNNVAFLYLGLFNEAKGAKEILEFTYKYKIKTFIYGEVQLSEDLKRKFNKLKKEGLIFHKNRLSSFKLQEELEKLFKLYRLIGFSLIKDIHYSYATQEANKDIDYMAMGIPFIGNYRIPTKEKIEKGCGVFFDNLSDIERLFKDKGFYLEKSQQCLNNYEKNYSQTIFKNKLKKIIEEL